MINQAAFGASGQWLLVWATGETDCCYIWDVSSFPATLHGKDHFKKVSASHISGLYCLSIHMTTQDKTASTMFTIWPYPSLPACILRESHGGTFVAQTSLSEQPRSREPLGIPNFLTACVIDDHSLLCVSNPRPLSKNLHRYQLTREPNHRREIFGPASRLGTAKVGKNQITRMISISTVGVVVILICTNGGEVYKYQSH